MKKLLIVCSCFYPATAAGGPAVSVTNLAKLFSQSYAVSVITSIRDHKSSQKYDGIKDGYNRLFGCDVYYLEHTKHDIIYKTIKKIEPDILYISSLFNYQFTLPSLRYARRYKNVTTVLAPRGELMPGAIGQKTLKKRVYLLFMRMMRMLRGVTIHVTSFKEMADVKNELPRSVVKYAKNPIYIKDELTKHPKKETGHLSILFVGRVYAIKNIDLMISAVGKCSGHIDVYIYGPIEDQKYYEKCMEIASHLDSDKTVKFCGMIDNAALETVYAKSHVFVSLSKTENYGNTIVEALSYSCPVIISENTPWKVDSKHKTGYCVSINGIQETVKAIQDFVDMEDKAYCEWCHCAHEWIKEKIVQSEIEQEYVDLLQ